MVSSEKCFMMYCMKHFSELTTEELLEIYKLRVSVFVVEQKCPYQEVDDADRNSYHIWFQDEDGIQAYARVMDDSFGCSHNISTCGTPTSKNGSEITRNPACS